MQGMSGLRYREGMGAAGKIPLVVLPGMDGSGVLLTALVECLVPFRPVQVIAFPNETPLGYDDLTAFVLQRTPSERFVVLGESFSGPIAIEVAATQQRVAGLILASSFARHPMPTLLAPLAGMLDLRWLPARLVEAALLGSADRSDLTDRLRRVLAKLPREVIRARACMAVVTDWCGGSIWMRSSHCSQAARCGHLRLRICCSKLARRRRRRRSTPFATICN
jgi:pimeloyl-ACP methyl ester carboxylesterase